MMSSTSALFSTYVLGIGAIALSMVALHRSAAHLDRKMAVALHGHGTNGQMGQPAAPQVLACDQSILFMVRIWQQFCSGLLVGVEVSCTLG